MSSHSIHADLDYLYHFGMDIKGAIAKWVKSARETAKLSGEKLGERIAAELDTERGITRANISHWETQKHQPSLEQIIAIKKITGVQLPAEVLDELGVGQNKAQSGPASFSPGDLAELIHFYGAADDDQRREILEFSRAITSDGGRSGIVRTN